ncbi:hypothetical protein IID23_01960 [Patescibacteria group bacterium]|nr:hypothetical protein [Patescibacteria group bacterium]
MDIWEVGRETSRDFDPREVLEDIKTVLDLIKDESPLGKDDDSEGVGILGRWSEIRLNQNERLFRVPASLRRLHERYWEPVRKGKQEVALYVQEGKKEQALRELEVMEANIRKLLDILEP